MIRGEEGCEDGSGFVIMANEMASCAVASIACAISIDRPDALTLVIAAVRRG